MMARPLRVLALTLALGLLAALPAAPQVVARHVIVVTLDGLRWQEFFTGADHDYLKRLWTTAESMPEYAGQTALLVATDHGRSATTKDWTDHGREVPAAERTWMAVMGLAWPRSASGATSS
jgi:hypothetical protein